MMQTSEGARLALIEQCRLLLTFRRDAVPCSHNLLAQLRDDAVDGHLGDVEANTITTILNAKLSGRLAKTKGVDK